jgi:signal transduction histidine kinase
MRALSTFHLRTRLFLLVVLAVLPALGVILFNDMEQRRFAARQAQEDALQLAQLAAAEQAQLIQGAHQLLSALAQLPAVREGDAKSCSELFAKLLNQYPVYVNLGVSRADGAVFCSASPLTQPVNVSSFTWFQRVMQNRDFSIGDYQKSAISDNFVLVVGFPIFDKQEQIAGVAAASLDLRWLSQLAVQARLPQEATLTAVDRNGVVVARHPDPQQWVGGVLQEAPLLKAMLAQEEGTIEIQGGDGVPRLYAFTQVREAGDVGLRVSVGIPMAVAFAHVRRLLVRNLTTLGIVTLLMLGVAWVGSDLWVLRPVYALLRVTQQLRAGDLHARTGLPQGFGELDQLVVAFDDMAEALEHREIDQRRAQETMQQLSRRLLEAQENERRAIARELHDEFGQALQALKINLQTAQRVPTDGAQRVADSIEIVDRTLQQVRNLSLDLRPSLLDDLGLVAALEWYIERQTQRTGIAVHFDADPPELRLEPTRETVCFRVAQEALTNVARHAHARNAWVELHQRDADVHLVIRDDGVGFDSQAARAKAAGGASFGVLGMQERVELAGGQFDITSTPGQGTEIRARFPLSSSGGAAGVAAPGTASAPALSAREP